MVRHIDNEIRHYINGTISAILLNQSVTCCIDKTLRMVNARYHTAGHLLGNITQILYPNLQTVKGHSFPNEAYVEFLGNDLPDVANCKKQ